MAKKILLSVSPADLLPLSTAVSMELSLKVFPIRIRLSMYMVW